MIYNLLLIIIALFLISYTIFKDLFHPAVIVCESYLFACLCLIYKSYQWGYNLENQTIFIIATGITSFIVGSFFVLLISKLNIKNKMIKQSYEVNDIKPTTLYIDKIWTILLLIVSTAIFIIHTFYWIRAIGGFTGIENISSQMTTYKFAVSFGDGVEYGIPTIISQLTKVIKAIAYIYMYRYIRNNTVNKYLNKKMAPDFTFIYLTCIYSAYVLTTGGRFELIIYFLAFLIMWVTLENYYFKHKSYSLKTIIKILCFLCLAIITFSITRSIVGRTSDSDIFDYVARYFGGGIRLLDEYIKFPVPKSDIWGKETFLGINKLLHQLGIGGGPNNIHLEFRDVNGFAVGNVYTSMRGIYHDFGLFGLILLQGLLGIIMSIMYTKTKNDTNKINIGLIMYSIITHVVFFSSYAEPFYNTVLSTNYLIFYIVLWIISKTIKKFKVKI